jgi:hypothetical protein
MPTAQLATPETYLDSARAAGFVSRLRAGVHGYEAPTPANLQLNQFALQGLWRINSEAATPAAAGASIETAFQAANVYLVMTSAGNLPRQGRVLLDGRPIAAGSAGNDVHGATVTVRGQRLYSLVSLPSAAQHVLTIELPQGVSAYSFTFG